MKILEIKVLKGPNYWSVRRIKLIQMKLDLEEMEQRPTNAVPGFRQRLEKMFPTMIEHRCSVGTRGGFFERVEEYHNGLQRTDGRNILSSALYGRADHGLPSWGTFSICVSFHKPVATRSVRIAVVPALEKTGRERNSRLIFLADICSASNSVACCCVDSRRQ